VVGDWNGNGTWTPGVLRGGSRWYLKDSFSGAAASVGLRKQTPGTPVVGDWDNLPWPLARSHCGSAAELSTDSGLVLALGWGLIGCRHGLEHVFA
jgi:hypothetical protein